MSESIMFFKKIPLLFNFLLLLFSQAAFSQNNCDSAFPGSRLSFQHKALQRITENQEDVIHTSIDPIKEREQVQVWNTPSNAPPLLKAALPKGVDFVPYQLYLAQSAVSVKGDQPGTELILRAEYGKKHKHHTNVIVSIKALEDNMRNKSDQNWLVGENADAAIIYLHGGGTKSTGGHTGAGLTTFFAKHNIHVISPDLPWHAQGHRDFYTFDTEIELIGDLAKKYIPPHVPVFVYGHSWGSIFAERIMMMSEDPNFDFHPSLAGTIITSTAIDATIGETDKEKRYKELTKIQDHVKHNLQHLAAPTEVDLWKTMIADGKTSPLGGFYTLAIILQFRQLFKEHQGDEYIPSMMAVGLHDSLVFLGYEESYKEYYKAFNNIESHYLDRLPYGKKNTEERVGHLLGDFKDPKSGVPIDRYLSFNFVTRQTAIYNAKLEAQSQLKESNLNDAAKKLLLDKLNKPILKFEVLEEIFSTEEAKQLDSAVLEKITQSIASEKQIYLDKKTILEKSRQKNSNIPNPGGGGHNKYFNLIQDYANYLDIREYIKTAADEHANKNDHYRQMRSSYADITQELKDTLYNYGGAHKTVWYSLNQLLILLDPNSNQKPEITLEMARSNIHRLYDTLHLPETSALSAHLKAILSHLENPNVENNAKALENAKAIIEIELNRAGKNRVLDRSQTKSDNKNILLDKLLEIGEIKKAEILLKEAEVPQELIDKTLDLLSDIYTYNDLMTAKYIPELSTLKKILKNSNANKSEEGLAKLESRLEKDHKMLVSIIEQKEEVKIELNQINKKLKVLGKEFHKMTSDIEQNISILRLELEKVSANPPDSLTVEFAEMMKEFEKVTQLELDMERALDDITNYIYRGVDLVREDTTRLIQAQNPKIEAFGEAFSEFVKNRTVLERKVITAMEHGELGPRAKQAAIKIYGHASKGLRPVAGASIYTEYNTLIENIASLESRRADLEHRKYALLMDQKEALTSLESVARLDDKGSTSKYLKLSADMYNVNSVSASNILNKQGATKAENIEHIQNNAKHFEKIMNNWESLLSRIPHNLPVE